ncbi:MAG: helix-turn-helix domain-containing protein [Firmicutes bacterium]|nr:helix-turn-helix domain-containing protein [Bacillota bacterium]
MNIGEHIRKIRLSKKLTLEQLAKMINSTSGTLSHIEKGTRKPSIDMLEKIAIALRVPVNEFFTKQADAPDHTNACFSLPHSLKEDVFLAETKAEYRYHGKKQAKKLSDEIKVLFDSGELSEEDKDKFFKTMAEIYFDSKEKNKN